MAPPFGSPCTVYAAWANVIRQETAAMRPSADSTAATCYIWSNSSVIYRARSPTINIAESWERTEMDIGVGYRWYWCHYGWHGQQIFKSDVSRVHYLHSLLPSVKSNPYGLRSRDHNFYLPVCNNFRRKSLLYVVFFDLNRFVLSTLYVFLIARLHFFHMHVLLFILPFTIAIPTAFNSVACTFVTCFFQ